jgi:PAS domain S-box-containing protein
MSIGWAGSVSMRPPRYPSAWLEPAVSRAVLFYFMKLLVAEDDRMFQALLRGILVTWGYEPIIVGDGEEAWRQLSSETGPRIAILDWAMPRADGLEVCRRVRSGNLPHYVYIILLTGKTGANDLVAGLEAGADDYLAKPVNLQELGLRLRAGCRVLESEGRHRMFAEIASDGIAEMEHHNRIQFANRAVGMIFGCCASELIGRPFSELAPGFDRRLEEVTARPAFSNSSDNVRSWPPIEMIGKHRTGRDLFLEVSFCESVDNSQRRVLAAMIRDVTERRVLEGQRVQAQKLESIGQLAAGMAHEINTPIQYIGDNAKFLEDAFRDLVGLAGAEAASGLRPADRDVKYLKEEIPKAIEQLLQGVDHVARIVRAMKEFSHPGPVDKRPVDINHAIQCTALISKNEWKYVADLTTDLDPDLPPVPCLAGEFNQVILNLIVNAAHAIADVVGQSGQKGTIHISTRRNGTWAEIRVSDTGTGIPEAIHSRIFNPFFTTKEVGKGSGQGLTIAHTVIVQKHGGRIDFESRAGAGATFVIQIPLDA